MAKKPKVALARGKRKEAIARASVKSGKGRITINGRDWKVYFPDPHFQLYLQDILDIIGKKLNKVDITINVKGGGPVGQLQAVRTAIARGVVEYFGDESLEQQFDQYDKFVLTEDSRRVEPKKDRQKKARAKYQKSYR
ncbi:MAG: 30S ribosomal protein S9 [Candidatus Micrarchaeota archaeon]|nr:30S ribosomal protein S9 [Candidatus Micrarchaeota archaeon]